MNGLLFAPVPALFTVVIGLSLGRWLVYCERGGWQETYRCKGCGHTRPYPYFSASQICPKCAAKGATRIIARHHFWGGYTEKLAPSNQQNGAKE